VFDSPWYLTLLATLPIIAWRMFVGGRRQSVRFSSLEIASQLTPTLRSRLLWLPSALTLLAMLMLILSLARPREGREQTLTSSEGIAIELVVDRSGSMRAEDFKLDGERVDRLTAIKNVAGKFVLGDDDSTGRFSDLVGLITFAGFADGETPPTLDHAFLVSKLNQTEIVVNRREDGTAIGDAISLAVEKLMSLDTRRPVDEKLKSKVIILLTDGENNAGEFEPIQAAELAESMGIKIYTIGVGTKGEAPVPVYDQFMRFRDYQLMPVNIDEETLTKVADITGGKYYRATDTDSLEKIYAEIDQLEKAKVESRHFVDYRELAVQPYRISVLTVPPLLLIAFVLLAARVLLEQTWLREMT
jgi:Ca-activated chloride channel homolog